MKKRKTEALILLYLGLQQSERTPDTRSGQIKIEKYKHVSNSTCIYILMYVMTADVVDPRSSFFFRGGKKFKFNSRWCLRN